jgi:hypothetical protein
VGDAVMSDQVAVAAQRATQHRAAAAASNAMNRGIAVNTDYVPGEFRTVVPGLELDRADMAASQAAARDRAAFFVGGQQAGDAVAPLPGHFQAVGVDPAAYEQQSTHQWSYVRPPDYQSSRQSFVHPVSQSVNLDRVHIASVSTDINELQPPTIPPSNTHPNQHMLDSHPANVRFQVSPAGAAAAKRAAVPEYVGIAITSDAAANHMWMSEQNQQIQLSKRLLKDKREVTSEIRRLEYHRLRRMATMDGINNDPHLRQDFIRADETIARKIKELEAAKAVLDIAAKLIPQVVV